uniref:Uncharacterized protein n=1 Tax=Anguilla anguilla TaxID=7936 RepID=A0A0E9RBZ7_ANGAN
MCVSVCVYMWIIGHKRCSVQWFR